MIPLIIGGIIGALFLAANWDSVISWVKNFLPEIAALVRSLTKQLGPEYEAFGMMVADFLEDVNTKIEHKLYHKTGPDEWTEEVRVAKIKEDQLPPAIRRKLNAKKLGKIQEADITNEMEEETGLEISEPAAMELKH